MDKKLTMILFGIVLIGVLAVLVGNTWSKGSKELCEVYKRTYHGANRDMAEVYAKGLFDDSAPRETNRQLKMLSERTLQLITIQQMKTHKCDIPKIASGIGEYLLPALECQNLIVSREGNFDSPECDSLNWKSSYEDLEHFK